MTVLFDLTRLPRPDKTGEFCHPDIPCHPGDIEDNLKQLGYAAHFTSFNDGASTTLKRQYASDNGALARWKPTPPSDAPWVLVAKYHTTDRIGPYAVFVCPLTDRT